MVDALSGRWSDEIYNISISIYSEASSYDVYDQIGTFDMKGAGVSGTVELLGHSGEDLYALCRTADGARMELHYTSDGMLEVKSVSDEYGIEENTCLTCIQRFES